MKKAIAVTELMLILLSVAVGVGLLLLTKAGSEKAACMRDVELCRDSYALFSGALKRAIAARVDCVAISPPNCEKQVLEEEGTEDEKQQKTMFIIAENLRWCWHKTLGNKNRMGNNWRTVMGIGTDDVDFCLVCSEFTPKVNIPADMWNKYLDTHKPSGEQRTYEQFIDPTEEQRKDWKTGWTAPYSYRDIGFTAGTKYFVVSAQPDNEDDELVGIYITSTSPIPCGTSDPKVHYQAP